MEIVQVGKKGKIYNRVIYIPTNVYVYFIYKIEKKKCCIELDGKSFFSLPAACIQSVWKHLVKNES